VAARSVIWILVSWILPVATQFYGDFLHGVASGDPFADSVVLWTRVTPRDPRSVSELPVSWEVWPEEGGKARNVTGETSAKKQRDFTVKVEVSALRPGVYYSFRFTSGSAVSPLGRFRLPPAKGAALESLRYAIFSCSNWQWGSFAAYARAAAEELDFWLHLGDFIYEYGSDVYPELDRIARPGLEPAHEIVTLQDYRTRYAVYRTDPDLQTLAAAAPMIPIWDDHEVANDDWMHGAQNHQPATEGDFEARKVAAMQAYHEWMPTRFDPEANSGLMEWRAFHFGDLSTLLVLETRLTARTSQGELTGHDVRRRIKDIIKASGNRSTSSAPWVSPEQWPNSELDVQLKALQAESYQHRSKPEKQLLGSEQLQWIREHVTASSQGGVRWRLIAQQLAQPLAPADFEAAIGHARSNPNTGVRELGDHWASSWDNATVISMAGEPSYVLESLSPWARSQRGHRLNITEGNRENALMALASARYEIPLSYDGWEGYLAERGRFLSAISQGGDPSSTVVYGGDSHNAWVGSLRNASGHMIATEFDGMSVSSPGIDAYQSWLPADLVSAAWVSANQDLTWADTEHRGFMLVSLSQDSHNVSYRSVDTGFPGTSGASECLAMFTMAHGQPGLSRRSCRLSSSPGLASSPGSAPLPAAAPPAAGGHSTEGGTIGDEQAAAERSGPDAQRPAAAAAAADGETGWLLLVIFALAMGCVLGCLLRHFAVPWFSSPSPYKSFEAEPRSMHPDARTLGSAAQA